MMQIYFLVLALFLLNSCVSSQKSTWEVSTPPGSQESNIDYVGLQRWLGLERPGEDLGYQERSFNTCKAGFGYSTAHNCRTEYFVSIHYRLQCRSTEGTTSVIMTDDNVRPISNTDIYWKLKSREGVSATDRDGYGKIYGIFNRSQRYERLKLSNTNDFLYIRAGELKRIVTPRPWCH